MSLHLFATARSPQAALPISHVVVHEPPAPPAPVLVPYDWALEDTINEDSDR